jgi:hypothetical protein
MGPIESPVSWAGPLPWLPLNFTAQRPLLLLRTTKAHCQQAILLLHTDNFPRQPHAVSTEDRFHNSALTEAL